MEPEILHVLTRQLVGILKELLPKLSTNWWNSLVFEKLTFQQQALVREHRQQALDQLDLAALLRIADQNWYDLARLANLNKDARNWLKEAMSIRNRWAHAPAGGLDDDTRYRDLDTIERLLQAFGASGEPMEALRQGKQNLLVKLAGGGASAKPAQASNRPASGQFRMGEVVRLKAKPATTGAIVGHLPGEPEPRYQVFHDGAVHTYYASQIETATTVAPLKTVLSEDLHARLTALQLRHPGTRHLYSLFASRIQFVPYQFRPVLKLIQSDRPRLLIADEVGVGKTIEAGLILKELQARRELQSVLVICPKPLVAERKWQEEMKRFDERFEHLDSGALRYCFDETDMDGVWPQKYSRAIVPYSLFDEALLMGNGQKLRKGLLDLDPPPVFDLVIVDEAHHIRNPETWAYRAVRYFCDNAEAVVLMSATPIQLGSDDLYHLLHLVRPDILPSRREFEQMAAPNPHLNVAIEAARMAGPDWKYAAREAIGLALATPWGRGVLAFDPRLQEGIDCLAAEEDDATMRLALIRQLEELYTFSPLINRTRRRDIGNFTTRKPETVAVDFTPEQSALHGDLIGLIARILRHRHGDLNLAFMLSTVRRQIASCVFGLAPLLENMLQRHLTSLELSELDDEDSPADIAETLAEFRAEVDGLIRRARALNGPDPKLEAFLQVIRDKQALPNNKLLAFSSFRHTLAYLMEKLAGVSVRVGLIHGDIPDEERRALRNRFSLSREDPRALDVLLSSEVGCEGLDYQFCDGMVNYDLPWNPMRVEQRIGRIDRYGQKSKTVVIYNFVTPGTVDADIYQRCLLRIGVFRQALGGSEEILGKLTRDIRAIAENFALSPEEQSARLQQLADNEIRAVQEQARLEEVQAKLFGLSLPKRDEEMVRQAESFWLAPVRLANLVARYLAGLGASNLPASLGQKPVVTLQLGQEIRDKLRADYEKLKLSGEAAQAWSCWLKGNDPYLPVTFEPGAADERRDLVFVTPTHPLARQAAQALAPVAAVVCHLQARADDLPPGRHPYAIYRWCKLGLKEDFTFQPVCIRPELVGRLLELLEAAQPLLSDIASLADGEESALEQAHYRHWADARAAHIEQVTETARSRLASLGTTHAARLALLEEQRDQAGEARIRRMREAQIEAAKRDYEQRAEELRDAPGRADLIADGVVLGVLVVEEGQ